MRLEYRTQELIEETETYYKYKLKCSLEEALTWKSEIISEEPLIEYKKEKYNDYDTWYFNCYTENVGTGIVIDGKDYWDEHLTFIMPDYWKNQGLKEGFYEAGEYENAYDSLKCYVRRLAKDGQPEKDYCLQYPGGSGDPEYTYLKALCDIEEALVWRNDIVFEDNEKTRKMLKSMLPLGVRTNIIIKIYKGYYQ